jgi:hypothetical protein
LGHPKIALKKDYIARLLLKNPWDLTVVNGGWLQPVHDVRTAAGLTLRATTRLAPIF